MAVDFHQLIARNRRNSWILIAVFILFVGHLGALLGYAIAFFHVGEGYAPQYALGVMCASLVMAGVGAAGSYFGGASTILRMSRARPIEKADDPQLFNVVEEMALAAGVPMPKVYVIDDTAPNAFATGRDPKHGIVAITTGLRSKLTRDELQAVIAHEIAHIRNLDIRFALLMSTLVGIVVLMCDMFLRSLHWGRYSGTSRRSSRRSSRSDHSGGAAIVIIVVILLALILSIIAPMLAKIIEMAFSRQREYLADASAVELTRNPEALASALSRIHADPEVLEVANRATAPMYIVHPIKHFEERASTIFDSHPPIKDRIQRILSLTRVEVA